MKIILLTKPHIFGICLSILHLVCPEGINFYYLLLVVIYVVQSVKLHVIWLLVVGNGIFYVFMRLELMALYSCRWSLHMVSLITLNTPLSLLNRSRAEIVRSDFICSGHVDYNTNPLSRHQIRISLQKHE